MRKRPPYAERLVLRAFAVAADLRLTCCDDLGNGEAGAEEASGVGDGSAPFDCKLEVAKASRISLTVTCLRKNFFLGFPSPCFRVLM
ncbi:hypothetical protein JMJ77_0011311 [Colletotrichum scovillei]|uniref:Uncharacterized protein n=1 Tax=Colletotrichum scovillei TaxID=1209932 RepID=A0A9P7R1S1_9PEZI|nr:hypothetical protein JMJ77_0011311 [Colletotrichum scovillei]KAG7060289.1 hypothetical protein JMJ78_0015564 [Colletotrichum scovillei]KAG7067740.1 hypothetical protein JMJ76_0009168 [Colletotrichum scovillei]